GGQKQRVCIARAVCMRPEIYVFDDSFSALDFKTDLALRESLRKSTEGATRIIIAQRVGTIMDADRIAVVDGGRIVGLGTHDQLMQSCPIYRSIAESQLAGGS
ncbi:MAG: ABC transporter ATP-binding protein, partial [Methanomethylophilus sp.]|nr:ABC transporter ATP-binding protein [Methanomethylophilus sp.]